MVPIALKIPAFRVGDVVGHHGTAVVRFGKKRARDVVRGGGDRARASGHEHGDERLLEIVVRAFGADERAAPGFDLFPIELGAFQTAETDVDQLGKRGIGELFEFRTAVAIGGFAIDCVKGVRGRCQPVEEEGGRAEKEEVGVDDELPARRGKMGVDELAEIRIVYPAFTEYWKTGYREVSIELRDGFRVRDEAKRGEKAAKGAEQCIVERAVVVEDRNDRPTGVVGKGPKAERSLIPKASTSEQVEFDGLARGRREERESLGGFFHGAPADGGAEGVDQPRFEQGARFPNGGVPDAIEGSTGEGHQLWEERLETRARPSKWPQAPCQRMN